MTHPAVTSNARLICVVAAPGSGKTTGVLVPKAMAILADPAVEPQDVLLLTFSRVSAVDLRNKVRAMDKAPRATTVHSFALGFLLSEDNHAIRNRINSILLDFEKELIVADLKLIFGHLSRRDLSRLLIEFSAGWATRPHDQVFVASDEQRRFKAAVLNWLTEHEAAMMEEIIYHAVELADNLPNPEYLSQVKFVLVDEFQDLNSLEQKFIQQLSTEPTGLVVVGDPDQSIYGFKYAHPHGIVEFNDREDVESHESMTSYRCPRAVITVANQLLIQASPGRVNLVQPWNEAVAGETHFVRKNTQTQEFEHAMVSIQARLAQGTSPKQIIVLAPKRKLCHEFAAFAESRREALGISIEVKFAAVQKGQLTAIEKERLLLWGLLVKPDSLLHLRAFLGLPDDHQYAPEVAALKERYGGLHGVLQNADPEEFSRRSLRIRRVCDRVGLVRTFLNQHQAVRPVGEVLDELLPATDPQTSNLRSILDGLREEDDTDLPGVFRTS